MIFLAFESGTLFFHTPTPSQFRIVHQFWNAIHKTKSVSAKLKIIVFRVVIFSWQVREWGEGGSRKGVSRTTQNLPLTWRVFEVKLFVATGKRSPPRERCIRAGVDGSVRQARCERKVFPVGGVPFPKETSLCDPFLEPQHQQTAVGCELPERAARICVCADVDFAPGRFDCQLNAIGQVSHQQAFTMAQSRPRVAAGRQVWPRPFPVQVPPANRLVSHWAAAVF